MRDAITKQQDSIIAKIKQAWQMASMFLANKDAHGLHDSGVEIQALERSFKELEELRSIPDDSI